MKFTNIKNWLIVLLFIFPLSLVAQTSEIVDLTADNGVIDVKEFKLGSSDVFDLNPQNLESIDILMKRNDIDVTFFGAVDAVRWNNSPTKTIFFNTILQHNRANALKERYGWGDTDLTDELFRGVKVVWQLKPIPDEVLTTIIHNDTTIYSDNLSHDHPSVSKPFITATRIKVGAIKLFSSNGSANFMLPFVAFSVEHNTWRASGLYGGVPFKTGGSSVGDVSKSFLGAQVTKFVRDDLGIVLGAWRSWEYLTGKDTWNKRVSGFEFGTLFSYKAFEFQPMATYSHFSSIFEKDIQWNLGFKFYAGINLK